MASPGSPTARQRTTFRRGDSKAENGLGGLASPLSLRRSSRRTSTLRDAAPLGLMIPDLDEVASPTLQSPLEGSCVFSVRAQKRQRALTKAVMLGSGLLQAVTSPATEQPESPVLSPEEEALKLRRAEIMKKARRIFRSVGQARLFGGAHVGKRKIGEKKAGAWFAGAKPKKAQQAEDHLADAWSVMEREQAKSDDRSGIALPTAADLAEFPGNLQQTFRSLAMRTLRKFLYPKLLLCLKRRDRRRLYEAHRNCPPMTVQLLQRQQIFAHCSTEVLADVVQKLVLMNFEAGEFLIHEHENAGSGIFFIMTGKIDVLKKKVRKDKRLSPDNTTRLVTLPLVPGQVVCVGEFSFLTEEPRMASCRAVTVVDCWVLRKHDWATFVKRLQQQNSQVFSSVVDIAFRTRKETMHLSYPMKKQKLCLCPIFSACPEPMVQEYLNHLVPYAVPKDFLVLRGEMMADKILFLQNGRCAVHRFVARRQDGDGSREATHVHTLVAPCVIADTAVLHSTTNGDNIMTLSTCDFWCLRKEDFDAVLRRFPGVAGQMMGEARSQRQNQLATQQNLFRESIHHIPYLGAICPRPAMRELVRMFVARVLKPMSILCSTSELANRVIIVYKGRVRVGDSGIWRRGECAGYTCVVPHRWAVMAVALEVVESLELDREQYEEFLHTHGLHKKMLDWVKRLLFPLAFHPEDVRAAHRFAMGPEAESRMRLHPRSLSARVNLCDEGFRAVHPPPVVRKRQEEATDWQVRATPLPPLNAAV
eukprot:TRINITY_DN13188_c0_g1_i2.p1 TRINITY_DN13188_c0_g1~~TRINITY_DN13188_c0_g1_i2.p1  ORF type:complete len:840 (+),score=237.79 TRINITY_DN13188_c0_g1_i2:241-2520(+)